MAATFDPILQAGIDAGAAPGAVATVVSRAGVVWEGGAGERVAGVGLAMTPDTVGAIFSMTKAVTGADDTHHLASSVDPHVWLYLRDLEFR